MTTNTLKGFTLGAAAGILAMLLGMGAAKADCAHDAHELNVWRAEALCDQAVQHWIEDDGLTEEQIDGSHGHDGMWEACMRLATPVTVLSASQHYDTTDGAFWRTEGGL